MRLAVLILLTGVLRILISALLAALTRILSLLTGILVAATLLSRVLLAALVLLILLTHLLTPLVGLPMAQISGPTLRSSLYFSLTTSFLIDKKIAANSNGPTVSPELVRP